MLVSGLEAEAAGASLDPLNWEQFRRLAHRALDDMIDDLSTVRDGPVWQPMPQALRQQLRESLPRAGQAPEAVYEKFDALIRPYSVGNRHPAFMGWVHGGGSPVGMLAEMLAGALNVNAGGRDHAAIEVEREVIRWSAEMLGLPLDASGLLVTGTSLANMIAVLVARTTALGPEVRREGNAGRPLRAYTSRAAHGCISAAMDFTGFGSDALRTIPTDAMGRIDLGILRDTIAADRARGEQPFLIVGTAGTVDTGAVDPLAELAALAAAEGVWFHVDAAFGATLALSPVTRGLLRGIEQAQSVAFDFHKLGQVPYDAGCILVRDPELHLATFAQNVAYLDRSQRGLAANAPWPCDFGPDLSRGFRALKIWMTLQVYGGDALGRVAANACDVAAHLGHLVQAAPDFELLAPVATNIVCFRVLAPGADLNRLNADIVADLHVSGAAAPSTTTLDGRLAIRAAIVNHRTTRADAERLVEAVRLCAALRQVPSRNG